MNRLAGRAVYFLLVGVWSVVFFADWIIDKRVRKERPS